MIEINMLHPKKGAVIYELLLHGVVSALVMQSRTWFKITVYGGWPKAYYIVNKIKPVVCFKEN